MEKVVLILDFGSQYTQLIARRAREMGVYSEIYPYSLPIEEIKKMKPGCVILSGGPSSVLDDDAPMVSKEIFELGVPVLGICYGLHLITRLLDGEVKSAHNREYGRAVLNIENKKSLLFKKIKNKSVVWMSHGDSSARLPEGFSVSAKSEDNSLAAFENASRNIYAVQFHPEVVHSEEGKKILSNFIFNISGLAKNWSMENFVENEIKQIQKTCSGKSVVLGVSGGVDSTTLAVLMYRALGDSVTSVFVNNGLLRMNEDKEVLKILREDLGLKIHYADASNEFLTNLKGEVGPEEKRKIIGKTFINVFFKEAGNFDLLAQGTLYPDVIESVSVKGPSRTIKTHHNRVDEVQKLEKEGRVIEPFKFLFKDEVREVARILNIPAEIFNRHPFPGPGMAVRILGDVTPEKLEILQKADKIFIDELKSSGWYDKIWQAFAVFLPVKSVGVMGDERAYGNVIALRAVTSVDGMTANWGHLPYEVLDVVGNRIVRQIQEVNRVVYDITSKPPATIEWE